ncbi:D-alanyl-D-alanine carboxypeptidase [Dickeya dianthicola]|uniref:D-alanyl-D-alanine carboxypeptidase n=1 Tax=Dickeya dianthicola TaxID=204039 RepID=A0AAX1C0Q2_9GAMM|nr:D-alanyl-D-alanine carboxypeptidase family protein [Dickeya dianthicola]MCI4002193.1 D-alanyl-D-alanine carboxypeptidase [Dickeya dianthicola]PWD69244.1 D-alanyl-D-alanine carboxypeptidase [Dickeya dianthicola]
MNTLRSILLSWIVSLTAAFVPSANAAAQPAVAAASWLVLDGESGQVLAEHNADERRDPASLTKLMTAYVVMDALKRKALSEEEFITVSASDISPVASDEARMYLKAGQRAKVKDLLRGLIVASANDAAAVLANRVGTNANGFARLMNDVAFRLGMKNSHFVTSSGVTTPNHYTTARDLSRLALKLTADFPEYYSFSSQQLFSYGGFSKRNKNSLLALDSSVDGLKTGHTQAAGWCIVATAKRRLSGSSTPRRVFAVVLGAPTDKQRIVFARQLLEYAFNLIEKS